MYRKDAGDAEQTREILTDLEGIIADLMADKDYNVMPASLVQEKSKGKDIQNLSKAELCSLLNVDGVILSKLYDYNNVFFINHALEMMFSGLRFKRGVFVVKWG